MVGRGSREGLVGRQRHGGCGSVRALLHPNGRRPRYRLLSLKSDKK